MDVLDKLNSRKMLTKLIFIGGTMLRLCFGLNRFSVDLDFWVSEDLDQKKLFSQMKEYLSGIYTIKDAANKFHTILFELKAHSYPRALKIDIRKEKRKVKTDKAIAYSQYSNTQVMLKVASLPEMMRMKIDALLNRQEIRDAFDMEFLLKKGIALDVTADERDSIARVVKSFRKQDYSVTLGSLLEEKERAYYKTENFKLLLQALAISNRKE